MVEMKICKKCKIEKSLNDFWKDAIRKDGHQCYCKECMRIIRKKHNQDPKNKEKLRIQGSTWRISNRNSWSEYFPLEMICEVCSRKIYFNKQDRRNAVNFDHRQECVIKITPSAWIGSHKFNEESRKIWESCNFGILCIDCNILLPTKNRKDWLLRITNYINK